MEPTVLSLRSLMSEITASAMTPTGAGTTKIQRSWPAGSSMGDSAMKGVACSLATRRAASVAGVPAIRVVC